jgi:2,4-dienoyl-CoA reductase-like NADH-dependent reductase (Old Yellow Enzyme family)
MADVPQAARPRLFTPGCIGNVELKNRVVMPSMDLPTTQIEY